MLLSEYDIEYHTQKAIKGSILADHLAHQPIEDYQSIKFDFPDEDVPVEISRLIEQDEKVIQPFEELVELVNLLYYQTLRKLGVLQQISTFPSTSFLNKHPRRS